MTHSNNLNMAAAIQSSDGQWIDNFMILGHTDLINIVSRPPSAPIFIAHTCAVAKRCSERNTFI